MPSNNEVTYTAGLKLSSNVRKLIYKNGDRLYISLSRCKVFERHHILQCYHCQRPGHTSSYCADKKREVDPTCYYCSKSHQSKDCPDKLNRDKHCCSNCTRSDDPDIKAAATTHNASNFKCPILQLYRENLKARTENWSEKKW